MKKPDDRLSHSKLWGTLLISLWVLVVVVIPYAICNANDTPTYYVISGEPQSHVKPMQPFSTFLYRSGHIDSLELAMQIENSGLGTYFINCYPRLRLVLIGIGNTTLTGIRVVSMDSPNEYKDIFWDDARSAFSPHLVIDSSGESLVEVSFMHNNLKESPQYRSFPINYPQKKDLARERHEFRFAGPTPLYSSGYADIEDIFIDENGKIIQERLRYSLPTNAVNVSDKKVDYQGRWNVLAWEYDYIAFSNLPDNLVSYKLLIYNRLIDSWSEYTIPGGQTRIRPINEWLVGTLTRSVEESNLEKGFAFPPERLDKVIMINAKNGLSITETLGNDCEILYAHADSVLYRIDESLYSATITDDGFTDKALLVSDPAVKNVHWAFPE